jgi:hypothetical protein
VASPGPTIAPTPTAPVVVTGDISWTRTGVIDADMFVYGAAAEARGFVVAGEDRDGRVGIWTSTDGLTWQRATVEGAGIIRALSLDGPHAVAVGCTDCGADGLPFRPAVWTSDDLTSWSLTTLPGKGLMLMDIAPTQSGYAATEAGALYEGCPPQRLLRSADGLSWQRVDAALEAVCGAIYDLVRVDDRLLLLGPSSWSSTGTKWMRIGKLPAGLEARFAEFVDWHGGVLAMAPGPCESEPDGGHCGSAPWTSADGVSWTRQSITAELDATLVEDVVRFGAGLVAVGSDERSQEIPIVLWSSDGIAWSRAVLSETEGSGVLAVAVLGDRIIALDLHGTVWLGLRG